MHAAIHERDLEIFRCLIGRGADSNAASANDEGEESALSVALRCHRAAMLKELLIHGADPKLSQSIAVVTAAEYGNVEGWNC